VEREEQAGEHAPGIFESGRALLGTLVQLLHTRVELFTTELEEEMHRIARLLLWAAVAIFCGGLFVLMVSLTVVIAFWDDHRLLVAGILSGVYLAVVLFAVLKLREALANRPRLLAASREELRRDRDALAGRDTELPG
jgi:uncharacterized membrane protein YqjE